MSLSRQSLAGYHTYNNRKEMNNRKTYIIILNYLAHTHTPMQEQIILPVINKKFTHPSYHNYKYKTKKLV